MADRPELKLDLRAMIEAAVGGVLTYALTTRLPGVVAAFVCAASFVFMAFVSSRIISRDLWWCGAGAVVGSVIGTATSLSAFGVYDEADLRAVRYTVVGTLSLAGLASGIFRGRDEEKEHAPKPLESIKGASALTVVAFAIVVTALYPMHGLDRSRSVYSKLSTMTTIVVTALAVPGWVGFQIGRWFRRRSRNQSREQPRD